VYHCHCHQSKGPAGEYQGVGNGNVVFPREDNVDEGVVDSIIGLTVVLGDSVVLEL
jgi:hypothetical protein